jgi:hypothetical protein
VEQRMSIASYTNFNRDNVINLIKQPDFFTKNPDLQQFEAQFAVCHQSATAARKKSSCGCAGAGTKMYTPCVEAILEALDTAKIHNPAAVATFVKYATTREVGENKIKLGVQYTKNNGTQAHKYEFTA